MSDKVTDGADDRYHFYGFCQMNRFIIELQ